MKLNKETLKRILRTESQIKRFPKENLEARYTWKNILKANFPTNEISLPYFFREVHSYLDPKEKSLALHLTMNQISQIILASNPSLKDNIPKNITWRGSLGYERREPTGKDFEDTRKIEIDKILGVVRTDEEKAEISYLLAETTRPKMMYIDPRQPYGYYTSRAPKIPDNVINSVLEYFDLYMSYFKRSLFAERVGRYDIAVKSALKKDLKPLAVECLYLDGKTDEALDLLTQCATSPMVVKYWLTQNSEMPSLIKNAPRIQGMLEERLNQFIRNPSSPYRKDYSSSNLMRDIEELKKIAQYAKI